MDFMNIEIEKELKIIFMGTPEFAVPVLQGLIDNYKVKAVVTQPDKIRGKSNQLSFSPIKQLAYDNNIITIQPNKIKTEYQEIIDLEPDLIVTCAYGQIIPQELLDCPRLGCINVHASLLPKLRGGAPIHRAVMEGHQETGITIMYMNSKMDAGDIIYQNKITIENTDTTAIVHDKLSILGKETLLEILPKIIEGTNERIKQNIDEVTFATVIKREDEKINFNDNRKQIYNQIRGLNSWPGAYCIYQDKILKVWASYVTQNYPTGINGQITAIYNDGFGVKVGNGEVVFTEVQLEGKRKMNARDFVNGANETLVGKILR